MKPVVWSLEAQTAYREIIAYIAADNPLAASRVGARLLKAAAQLGALPSGRPGRVHGVYEKVVRGLPYTIAYVVTPELVQIVTVVHQARDWREGSWPD